MCPTNASIDYAVKMCGLTSKSRLGDRLITYAKAKWFSYTHNIPFVYKPFPMADKFKLHEKEKRVSGSLENEFQRKVKVHKDCDIFKFRPSTLFSVCLNTYFGGIELAWGSPSSTQNAHVIDDKPILTDSLFFLTDDLYVKIIENPLFGEILKDMLSPVVPVPTIKPPDNILSVAVHVRTSEAFAYDTLFEIKNQGLRFPPEQFYIDQICNLSRSLDDIPLYVFVFTDDLDPEALTHRLKAGCSKANILFDCRHYAAQPQHVLEDFYSMTTFDCLIRACSHFSGVAQLIGRHSVIIRPAHFVWKGGNVIIDKTDVIIPNIKERHVNYYTFDQISNGKLPALMIASMPGKGSPLK